MNESLLNVKLNELANTARELGYKLETPTLFIDPVHGNALAYYQHASNKIVMHDHFTETADVAEIIGTLIHELAHAVAEQNNTGKKRIWHGDEWKNVNAALGGNAERYHQGTYKKPAFKKMAKKDMFAIKPKHPADRWERGTYNQWLLRGYHVIKGQKGQFVQWEFSADEYETDQDGKTSTWGRASAVYFTADQVEANK
jgi:hypothetical protein